VKVLVYDIETIGVNALKADLGRLAVFGYKWLGSPEIHALTLADFKGFKKYAFDDAGLVKAAAKIMEEADLLVAHYGDKFDRRFFQGRCLINGVMPPPPTKQRDTCLLARRYYNFSSNRLGHLANILHLTAQKQRNQWPDWWLRTLAGDVNALRDMATYCKADVAATEELYLKLRPYDLAHPTLESTGCGSCGGVLISRGYAYVGVHRYKRTCCKQCGKWSRERKHETPLVG